MNPLVLTDYYKVHHHGMYPTGTTKIYSNLTPRKSRIPGVDKVVFFGLQHFILEYLIKEFDFNFFGTPYQREPWKKDFAIKDYKEFIPVETNHIEALWDLGYLPIEIKAVEEGMLVPIGVPCLTITNTHRDFAWVVNYLETLMSCCLWQPITSATIAYEYKKLLTEWAIKTGGPVDFVQWQGHDFSMRGMSSPESAILSGMGHLLSFTGTDTIPAIRQLKSSYEASGLIGASVPATEHSVQCMHYDFEKGSEDQYFDHLLKLYPGGIVSAVSDGFNLWDVITKTLPKFKDRIMARDGKLVIRPDSGDPVDILCGHTPITAAEVCKSRAKEGELWQMPEVEYKGVIELLWDIFGGTTNERGFKQLDTHIGAIYGDSITLDRARQICERLAAKGFASTNVVLGIGSYTYQYNTRDTFGFAIKATYGEVEGKGKEIYKDPITDDGTKKSKKGLLKVVVDHNTGNLVCIDQADPEMEAGGLLTTVFRDGKLVRKTTLEEIRTKLKL